MIVLVSGPDGLRRIIKSKSKNAAVNFVVQELYTPKVLSAEDLLELQGEGLKVEDGMEDDEIVEAPATQADGGAHE